jgi:hypothetical protein
MSGTFPTIVLILVMVVMGAGLSSSSYALVKQNNRGVLPNCLLTIGNSFIFFPLFLFFFGSGMPAYTLGIVCSGALAVYLNR